MDVTNVIAHQLRKYEDVRPSPFLITLYTGAYLSNFPKSTIFLICTNTVFHSTNYNVIQKL